MKKILLLILLTSSLCYSQRSGKKNYYGSVGIGLGFPDASGINKVIDFYNQTSPNLIKPMDNISNMYGFNFLFGVNFSSRKTFGNVEMGFYFGYSGKKTSQTRVNGVIKTQDVLIKYPLVNLGGQYFIRASSVIDLGAGMAFNMGSFNMLYRTYLSTTTDPAYVDVNQDNLLSDVGLSPTVFLNFHISKIITISLRPYYYLMLTGQDLNNLNFLLNGTSSPGDISDVSYSGPGVNLNFLIKIQ